MRTVTVRVLLVALTLTATVSMHGPAAAGEPADAPAPGAPCNPAQDEQSEKFTLISDRPVLTQFRAVTLKPGERVSTARAKRIGALWVAGHLAAAPGLPLGEDTTAALIRQAQRTLHIGPGLATHGRTRRTSVGTGHFRNLTDRTARYAVYSGNREVLIGYRSFSCVPLTDDTGWWERSEYELRTYGAPRLGSATCVADGPANPLTRLARETCRDLPAMPGETSHDPR